MLYVCLILNLFCGALCLSLSNPAKVEESDNLRTLHRTSLGRDAMENDEFKLTKLLDIKLKGGYNNLHPDLKGIIQSQVQTDVEGKVQNQESLWEKDITRYFRNGSTLEKLINVIESQSSSISDITSNCRYLVGVNKISPFCNQQDNTNETLVYPKSCKEIQLNGQNVSGVYKIQPKFSKKPFMVLCDMETMGGGWTHIHRRFDGSQDFFLDWRDYKFGFGNLNGEFWMGLENIHVLTGFEVNELLVEIVDRDDVKARAHYKAFAIGPEVEGYPLETLGDCTGDAGDSLTYHLGAKFSTKDFDQDTADDNCAVDFSSAWWYKSCRESDLNGKYLNVNLPTQYEDKGLRWKTFRGPDFYCHSKARMLIRPV